jgi:hypothetical protein
MLLFVLITYVDCNGVVVAVVSVLGAMTFEAC